MSKNIGETISEKRKERVSIEIPIYLKEIIEEIIQECDKNNSIYEEDINGYFNWKNFKEMKYSDAPKEGLEKLISGRYNRLKLKLAYFLLKEPNLEIQKIKLEQQMKDDLCCLFPCDYSEEEVFRDKINTTTYYFEEILKALHKDVIGAKPRFKDGEKVKVREDLKLNEQYDSDMIYSVPVNASESHVEFAGQEVTVILDHINKHWYTIKEDSNSKAWAEDMFEKIIK